jgi:hypothetical protein
MIEFSPDKKQIRICIPVSSLKDINRYYQSIITMLDRVEIGDCNPDFKEDLIAVYELLSHLQTDNDFFLKNTKECKQVIL